MSLTDKIWIKIFAKFVGEDKFNNKFYSYLDKKLNKERRYVIYKGEYEPSKVSPAWFTWLHYLTDIIPKEDVKYNWQSFFSRENLTGTDKKYLPEGLKNSEEFTSKIKTYEAWMPNNNIKKDNI